MSQICFVMLALLIFSLFDCDAQNVGFGNNDGSHSDGVESFWGNFLNKARLLMNILSHVDLVERPKSSFSSNLVTTDERQDFRINGSLISVATSRSSSCAVASVPCSCASATGTCTCTTTGCTCTVAPCTLNGATSSSTSSSSSGSSSSGSSSSGSSSSSKSSSGSSSSTSTSGTQTTTTTCVNCACTTTVCTNGVCAAPTSFTSTTGACG